MMINSFIPIWLMAIICVAIIAMKRKGKWAFIRQIIVALLLFCINLRIMIPSENAVKEVTNFDILFVVDTTISMVAEDYNGEEIRLDAVKHDMKEIVKAFPEARVSIITFDNTATRVLPFSDFDDTTEKTIDLLHVQKSFYADGTSLNKPIKEMETALVREEDYTGDPAYRMVFFISDGEVNTDEKLEDFSPLADSIECGAVLGYGTPEGGKMKVYDYSEEFEPEYITVYDDNFNENYALSKIDEDNLKQIASDLDVDYYHMTKKSDVEKIVNKAKAQVEDGDIEMKSVTGFGYVETYYYFAIALGAFLVYDAVFYRRKLKLKL
ncbi:MAG: VWA domain-containing protein [Clostridia bacterium]|nr:VWA domain-containing protein [Clostridia bacterium]